LDLSYLGAPTLKSKAVQYQALLQLSEKCVLLMSDRAIPQFLGSAFRAEIIKEIPEFMSTIPYM
jgi:hypothetical protein